MPTMHTVVKKHNKGVTKKHQKVQKSTKNSWVLSGTLGYSRPRVLSGTLRYWGILLGTFRYFLVFFVLLWTFWYLFVILSTFWYFWVLVRTFEDLWVLLSTFEYWWIFCIYLWTKSPLFNFSIFAKAPLRGHGNFIILPKMIRFCWKLNWMVKMDIEIDWKF